MRVSNPPVTGSEAAPRAGGPRGDRGLRERAPAERRRVAEGGAPRNPAPFARPGAPPRDPTQNDGGELFREHRKLRFVLLRLSAGGG